MKPKPQTEGGAPQTPQQKLYYASIIGCSGFRYQFLGFRYLPFSSRPRERYSYLDPGDFAPHVKRSFEANPLCRNPIGFVA